MYVPASPNDVAPRELLIESTIVLSSVLVVVAPKSIVSPYVNCWLSSTVITAVSGITFTVNEPFTTL